MSDRVAVMKDGLIRQIGPPREIYDHPTERFVAHFIGETNFLAGSLHNKSGSTGLVKLTSGADVPASIPEDVSNGEVTVVVRPEHALLSKDTDNASLTGTIKTVVYFGTDTHYHLELAQDEDFVVRIQNQRDSGMNFERGVRVGVTFKDNAVQVLRD